MSIDTIIREEARLIILKALAEEPDGRRNSSILCRDLELFGITRPRVWVEAEIRELEHRGAVRVMAAGTVLVAQLTARGQDHLERRAFLDGVKRPSLPEA